MAINLNLELTDHCNLRCGMCSQSLRDEAHGVPMRFMDWDTWRQGLQGLAGVPDDVHLCPHWLGEPTLHPEFDRFVEYAFAINPGNRLFREFKLHTNAVIFGEERARLLLRLANQPGVQADTFRFVHFSIDAHSPAVYATVKGKDRGMAVRRNIERFLRLRGEAGLERPCVTLAFVVQRENAHEARAFQDHWGGLLTALGRPWRTTYDWPDQVVDSIYFRPLNAGDQRGADALHAQVCADLGLTSGGGTRLRGAESF